MPGVPSHMVNRARPDAVKRQPLVIGPQQAKVLCHLLEADRTSIRETAGATGLTLNQARAALNGLASRGWAFERTGREGFDRDQEVPQGIFIITEEGRRRARTMQPDGHPLDPGFQIHEPL